MSRERKLTRAEKILISKKKPLMRIELWNLKDETPDYWVLIRKQTGTDKKKKRAEKVIKK